MKKSILIALLLLGFGSFCNAQSKVKPNSLVANSPKTNSKNNTSSQQTTLADKLIAIMHLTDNEQRFIKKICGERAEQIEKIKLNADTQQQKLLDLQAINEDFEYELKHNLSPINYSKYESLKH
jgi:hypothetical protein